MSRSNAGMNAIYNGGLVMTLKPQVGGSRALRGLNSSAKKIGLFRNVVKPLTTSLGINSPGIDSLVSKGYGKRKRGKGKRKSHKLK